jgi:hypothetical protein
MDQLAEINLRTCEVSCQYFVGLASQIQKWSLTYEMVYVLSTSH